MDCRTFLDLRDSYWCGELLVETYHSMLSHTDDCPACRCELAACAHLRARLRQAGLPDGQADRQADRRVRYFKRAYATLIAVFRCVRP